MRMGGCWTLEVDIRKFFDTLDHERLREIAFNSRTTVSGVVRDAVEEFVRKKHAEKKPRKKRKGV